MSRYRLSVVVWFESDSVQSWVEYLGDSVIKNLNNMVVVEDSRVNVRKVNGRSEK